MSWIGSGQFEHRLAEQVNLGALLPLDAVDPDHAIRRLYLPLEGHFPVLLGTGRNAVVFLAATSPDPASLANEYRAVKFLKDDIDQEYARESARRFFDEAEKARKFGRLHDFFVRYDSMGYIVDLERRWQLLYEGKAEQIRNAGPPYEALRQHFSFQGPFYVLELCQGTLHDLLDKTVPWSSFTVYRRIAQYRESLRAVAAWTAGNLADVVHPYMVAGTELAGMSGYDILNAFRNESEANRVRNFAVLDLFVHVAKAVRLLHAQEGTLAHRDLKPGNIFIWHSADREEIGSIGIKLADLGHVANFSQLEQGDVSLRQTWRSPGALIPGSQFYRAPEQAELPIEVRVDVDAADRSVVTIRSRKVGDIQPGDWLSIGDFFGDTPREQRSDEERDASLFKILAVEPHAPGPSVHGAREIYTLQLDAPVDLALHTDLQAHIIKATGYHTDGFSLGAILYDLASGGKNPEHFYTYCLMNFTRRFARLFATVDYSVDDVLNVLAPMETIASKPAWALPLTPEEKWRIGRRLLTAGTADELIAAVIETALLTRGSTYDPQDALRNYRFRHSHLVNDLLCDYRGVPIPRGILAIIVKCMLRDVPGAYYTSDRQVGFLSPANRRATEQIHRDVLELMGRPEYQPPHAFPQILRSHLLFKLRAFVSDDAT